MLKYFTLVIVSFDFDFIRCQIGLLKFASRRIKSKTLKGAHSNVQANTIKLAHLNLHREESKLRLWKKHTCMSKLTSPSDQLKLRLIFTCGFKIWCSEIENSYFIYFNIPLKLGLGFCDVLKHTVFTLY